MGRNFARFVVLFILCITLLFSVTPRIFALGPHQVKHSSTLITTDQSGKAIWPMLGYSATHDRINPYEKSITSSNVSHLTLAWTVSTSGFITSLDPVVSDGTVYFTSHDGKIYAVNAKTGGLVWSEMLGTGFDYASPAIAGNILYVVAGSNTSTGSVLFALNAKTGAMFWHFDGVSSRSSPTIVQGKIYIGGSSNNIYAINAAKGTVIWSKTLITTPNEIQGSLAVVNGIIYIPINIGTIAIMYALKASTGTVTWTMPMGAQVSDSSPAVANGLVYVGAEDGLLYAFDTANGHIKWTSPTIGNVVASPAIFKGLVYIGGNGNNKIFALNAKTGAVVWTTNTDSNVLASASIADNIVYDQSNNGSIYAQNYQTGTSLWTDTIGGGDGSISSPIVVNGMLYTGSTDGKLYAFHLPSSRHKYQ